MSNMIRICNEHDEEVPLIGTMAFNGAEFWCPYCGANFGLFGAGERVEETDELLQKEKHWLEKSRAFLSAMSRRVCVKTKFNGEWIDPADLPESEKQKDQAAIDSWTYEGRTP